MHWLHPGQWPVHIGFTDDEAAWKRCMKRMNITDPPPMLQHERAHMTMHTFESTTGSTYIITARPRNKTSKEQFAALIAHEALHIVQQMEDDLYPTGRFDDESAAYLLQYIVQHTLQHAWKTGRRRKVSP